MLKLIISNLENNARPPSNLVLDLMVVCVSEGILALLLSAQWAASSVHRKYGMRGVYKKIHPQAIRKQSEKRMGHLLHDII